MAGESKRGDVILVTASWLKPWPIIFHNFKIAGNKMGKDKLHYHALILSDEDMDRLSESTKKMIDLFKKETNNNIEEMAFLLRVLIETFEETQNCVVPFKNRYTEPTWNYDKKGIE